MLSCDRIESAKFIHGTLSPTKPVYYSAKCADLELINEKRTCYQIDFAIPAEQKVRIKESKKTITWT